VTDAAAPARRLDCSGAGARAAAIRCWLDEAHAADLFRKRLGRVHPHWGNGSLLAREIAEPRVTDAGVGASYLLALAELGQAIVDWRTRR